MGFSGDVVRDLAATRYHELLHRRVGVLRAGRSKRRTAQTKERRRQIR